VPELERDGTSTSGGSASGSNSPSKELDLNDLLSGPLDPRIDLNARAEAATPAVTAAAPPAWLYTAASDVGVSMADVTPATFHASTARLIPNAVPSAAAATAAQ